MAESNPWNIEESALPAQSAAAQNMVFALSNGAFGVTGITPFAARGTPGSYLGGVHAQVQSYVNGIPAYGSLHRDSENYPDDAAIFRMTDYTFPMGPQFFALRLRLNGHTVRVPLATTRALDLRHGVLSTRSHVVMPDGGELRLTTRRFVSLADLHLCAERIEIEAVQPGSVELTLEVDATTQTLNGHDFWNARSAQSLQPDLVRWVAHTGGTNHTVAVCLGGRGPTAPGEAEASTMRLGMTYRFDLRAGEKAAVERLVSVATSLLDNHPEQAAQEACSRAMRDGFDACLARHQACWEEFWKENDIRIDGPADEQQALRYCLFHLRSAAPPSPAYSIGPNFLCGGRYRALTFWDTDVFVVPYYIKSQPDLARRHMLYRSRTLEAAREFSKEKGTKGARYPWQAMADGREALVPWNIYAPNQVHITADVAWAVADYYRWTGDEEYMRGAGAEILAETARYWMSRMTRTERGLEIRKVCGPDETHPRVDNSAYTNILARENLRLAARFNPQAPEAERNAWLQAVDALYIPPLNQEGVLEQCDGFFRLPEAPKGAGCCDGDAYQSVKQADVIMLPVMLPGLLTPKQVAANYGYYEPRTTHESSLSFGIHAIVAARLGRMDEAHRQFLRTVFIDLRNEHKNTEKGLHAACTALAPRVVMEGFAGLRIEDGRPVVTPHLPESWKSVEFTFSFHGQRLRCRLTQADNGKTRAL